MTGTSLLPVNQVIASNEEDPSRTKVTILTVLQEDQTLELRALFEKQVTGPIRVISFIADEDGTMRAIHKGTIISNEETRVALIDDIELNLELFSMFANALTIVSYGPAGFRPVVELGDDFDGSNKPFSFWRIRSLAPDPLPPSPSNPETLRRRFIG